MRKIQIERKLFELFGYNFFVFENFQDADLNIDDKSVYKYDNQEKLINVFAKNQFYAIWSDERRIGAGVICACSGDISTIITFVKSIGLKEDSYSTFDCGLNKAPSVLFLTASMAMQAFIHHLTTEIVAKKIAQTLFFGSKDNKVVTRRKRETTEV